MNTTTTCTLQVSLFAKCDRCLLDMSALHAVDADPKKVEELENRDVDAKVLLACGV